MSVKMLKNIQFKIILIFFIIGILIIGGYGVFFINSLNSINTQIEANQIQDFGQTITQINSLKNDTKIILIVSSAVFIIVGIIIAVYLSKFVI